MIMRQHSSRHGSRSTSPQRKPRITQDEPRGSRARGSSAGWQGLVMGLVINFAKPQMAKD